MGVRGLTTFIEDNRRKFYKNEKVHDCHLVIDGFGLVYNLYFGANLDMKHGGEFAALTEVVNRFFTSLSECNIKPFVIFDGPIEQNKLPCVLNRLQDRVKDVRNILKDDRTFRGRLLPIFAVDTLLHYLWSHNIDHAATLLEADSVIVAVANYLDCPVLSEDSDYFIYNIKNGYIPLQHFYWEKVWVDRAPNRKSIVCQKYHVAYMYDAYGIPAYLLPYLSIMLGNDFLDRDTFKQLIANLPLMRSSHKQKHSKRKKFDARIECVLHWISTKNGNETLILRKLENSLSNNKRDAVLNKVDSCLQLYRSAPDVSKTLEALGLISQVPINAGDPYWEIKDLVRRSYAHPISMNLLESNYICLPVIMSDSTKPSPHTSAAEIRTLLYRVLLRKFRFKMLGPEFLFLQEYDKVDTFYQKSRTVSVFTTLCPFCEQHHSLGEGCKMAACHGTPGQVDFTTLDLLFKTLGLRANLSFQNFVEKSRSKIFHDMDEIFLKYLDILMVSTLIWLKKTSPKSDFVCALLLTVSWSLNKSLFFENAQNAKNAGSQSPSQHKSATKFQMEAKSPSKEAVPQSNRSTMPQRNEERPSPEVSRKLGGDPQQSESPPESSTIDSTPQPTASHDTAPKSAKPSKDGPQVAENSTKLNKEHRKNLTKMKSSRRTTANISEEKFLDLLFDTRIKSATGATETQESEFNVALLHSASQWLCILNASILLHQVVEKSRTKFPMQDFYSSSILFHAVHARIERLVKNSQTAKEDFRSLCDIILDRLDSVPQIKIFFQVLSEFLLQQ